MDIDYYLDKAEAFLWAYGPNVLMALATLLIGLWIIRMLMRLLKKGFEKSKVDSTLQTFFVNLIGWGLKVILFISVATKLGVETTSFVAIIGAAGLAIGLALQGTLANFAGGVLILLFKPFKVGDLIDAQGFIGKVTEIQIFVTKITTPESKLVIIPNGALSNGNITNISELGQLRVDLTIGISYDSDIRKAREILLKVMQDDEKTMKDPAPSVSVSELADSSVNLAVRPWSTPANYWDVYFGTLERCKVALDEAGISIPFPQRDVHLIKEGED